MSKTEGIVGVGAGSHLFARRALFIAILAVAALLTVTGCGIGGQTTTKASATPTAQEILASAQKVHLTDETFTVAVQGTSNGTAVNVTGTGKATENPARISMSLSTEVNGTTVSLDEVIDGATGASYTRITSPDTLASKTWTKSTDASSGPISSSDLQVQAQYSKITNPKLIGVEQVNGVDTWHVQGGVAGSDNTTIDVFVKKSDYSPVKMAMHSTGDAAVDVTLVYTAINSGISIELPAV